MNKKLLLVFCLTTFLYAYAEEPAFQKTPIILSAAKVLPAGMLTGTNYKIRDAVVNDGLINMYDLDTKYGALKVESTCLLRKRVNELTAITQIEGIKKSDIYLNALRQTAAVPVQTAKKLVTDPIGTTKQITSGISHFFTSVSSTVSNRSDSPENAMNSALGQSSYKRQFAYQFGVDPYSTYEPLQKALGDISWAAAAGGLTVKAAMMAIPGAAGAVVSATGTADTLQSLLRDKTAPELIQINQDRLHELAVPETTIQVFMHNPSYDLQEQTLLVAALTAMTNVADRRSFMETAAVANAESTGMFMRRSR